DHVGVVGDLADGRDVGGDDLGRQPERRQRLLGFHLEDGAGADPSAADGHDLHADTPMISRTSSGVLAAARREVTVASLNRFAIAPIDSRCVPTPATASPRTTSTGSLCGWPNATGCASVTTDSPSRRTESPGRACANARPGEM